MNEGEEHPTAALPAFGILGHTGGTEELSTSHEMETTLRPSQSPTTHNEDSLAGDSVRFNALVDLLATNGPNLRDQYQGEDSVEVVHPSLFQTSSSGPPLLTRHSDPFQTPERRPDVCDELWMKPH
jgi:hypothetical protein